MTSVVGCKMLHMASALLQASSVSKLDPVMTEWCSFLVSWQQYCAGWAAADGGPSAEWRGAPLWRLARHSSLTLDCKSGFVYQAWLSELSAAAVKHRCPLYHYGLLLEIALMRWPGLHFAFFRDPQCCCPYAWSVKRAVSRVPATGSMAAGRGLMFGVEMLDLLTEFAHQRIRCAAKKQRAGLRARRAWLGQHGCDKIAYTIRASVCLQLSSWSTTLLTQTLHVVWDLCHIVMILLMEVCRMCIKAWARLVCIQQQWTIHWYSILCYAQPS